MVVVRGKSSFAVCPGYGSLVPNKEAGHKTKRVGAGEGSLVCPLSMKRQKLLEMMYMVSL